MSKRLEFIHKVVYSVGKIWNFFSLNGIYSEWIDKRKKHKKAKNNTVYTFPHFLRGQCLWNYIMLFKMLYCEVVSDQKCVWEWCKATKPPAEFSAMLHYKSASLLLLKTYGSSLVRSGGWPRNWFGHKKYSYFFLLCWNLKVQFSLSSIPMLMFVIY